MTNLRTPASSTTVLLCGAFLATLVAASGCSRNLNPPPPSAKGQSQALSDLHGEAAGCFARTEIFYLGRIEIYVFPLEKSSEILRQINSFPEKPPETPDEITMSISILDQVLKTVKRDARHARRSKTDDQGRYTVAGLTPGKEYLVIGIVPPSEDSDEYFLDARTGKLNPGTTRLDLWEGSIPKEHCLETCAK